MTHSGSVLYQKNHSENGAEIYTIGIVADEDELNDVVLSIASFETVIDDIEWNIRVTEMCFDLRKTKLWVNRF